LACAQAADSEPNSAGCHSLSISATLCATCDVQCYTVGDETPNQFGALGHWLYGQLHPLLPWNSRLEFIQALKFSLDLTGLYGGLCRRLA
jgi:hypothetical protein